MSDNHPNTAIRSAVAPFKRAMRQFNGSARHLTVLERAGGQAGFTPPGLPLIDFDPFAMGPVSRDDDQGPLVMDDGTRSVPGSPSTPLPAAAAAPRPIAETADRNQPSAVTRHREKATTRDAPHRFQAEDRAKGKESPAAGSPSRSPSPPATNRPASVPQTGKRWQPAAAAPTGTQSVGRTHHATPPSVARPSGGTEAAVQGAPMVPNRRIHDSLQKLNAVADSLLKARSSATTRSKSDQDKTPGTSHSAAASVPIRPAPAPQMAKNRIPNRQTGWPDPTVTTHPSGRPPREKSAPWTTAGTPPGGPRLQQSQPDIDHDQGQGHRYGPHPENGSPIRRTMALIEQLTTRNADDVNGPPVTATRSPVETASRSENVPPGPADSRQEVPAGPTGDPDILPAADPQGRACLDPLTGQRLGLDHGLMAEQLTDLINDVLVSQARRHGVDV